MIEYSILCCTVRAVPVRAVRSLLGFWRFHQALEAQHAAHTMDELEEAYVAGRVTDEAKFEVAANEMLDACAVFWEGLDASRKGEPYELPIHLRSRWMAPPTMIAPESAKATRR